MSELTTALLSTIRDVPDFPKAGIIFKDIAPLFKKPHLLKQVIAHFADEARKLDVQVIAGIESRGFLLGTPLTLAMETGFVPVRKKGKLPGAVVSLSYELEYGVDHVEIQEDAIKPGERVLIFDDVLATGGTARAAADLIRQQGGEVVGFMFLMELGFLEGKARIREGFPDCPVSVLLCI